MALGVAITRSDQSAWQLRQDASRCRDGRIACRMLAIAQVVEGKTRTEAAASCGMDRQTLRDWVHRYNQMGIAGLANRPGAGRKPALTAPQMVELKAVTLAGPDLDAHGLVRWRCADLRGIIAERFGVTVCERTVGKLLARLGLSRLKPRPHNPRRDEAAQEAFKNVWPAPSASSFCDRI